MLSCQSQAAELADLQKHPADRRPGPGLKAHPVQGVRDHLTPLSDPGKQAATVVSEVRAICALFQIHGLTYLKATKLLLRYPGYARPAQGKDKSAALHMLPCFHCQGKADVRPRADAIAEQAEADLKAADQPSNRGCSQEQCARSKPDPLQDCTGKNNVPPASAADLTGKHSASSKSKAAKAKPVSRTSQQLDCT